MKVFVLLCFIFNFLFSFSQPKISIDLQYLQKAEDTLDVLSNDILDNIDVAKRLRSDSMLTRTLVRALKLPNSFYYPFDSLQAITIVYPADSSFRIFTWQFEINEQNYRQKGAIQMNTTDGSLALFPLFDASEYTEAPNDSIRSIKNWIGAIYYKIIEKEFNGRKIYTLLGYDENGFRSTKKWMEVLTFNENKQPIFGGDYFGFERNNDAWQPTYKRFNIEFKKDGRAKFNYEPDQDIIIYDHLISENNQPEKKYSYIPDGDYEGFKWKNGKWIHISKVFTQTLADGQAPKPDLLLNDNGDIDESKLAEQSEKNASKHIEEKPIRKKSKIALPQQ